MMGVGRCSSDGARGAHEGRGRGCAARRCGLPERPGRAGACVARGLRRRALRRGHRHRPALSRLRFVAAQPRRPRRPRPPRPGAPPRHAPPVLHQAADIDGVRAAHPLGAVLPLLRSTLVSIADEAVHVMIVTDADGTILWREGARSLLRAADSVGLAPGMRWSEDAIGTNAMGTALAVDEPVQIHSAEHLVRTVHAWTCAAAPVHDPDTGALIGAIDISGPLHTAHPAMVQLLAATAQLAENQLRVRLAIADEQLRIRNMPHLASLRGRPGARAPPAGRIRAGEPYTGWPARVQIKPGVERVRLDDGREMD